MCNIQLHHHRISVNEMFLKSYQTFRPLNNESRKIFLRLEPVMVYDQIMLFIKDT